MVSTLFFRIINDLISGSYLRNRARRRRGGDSTYYRPIRIRGTSSRHNCPKYIRYRTNRNLGANRPTLRSVVRPYYKNMTCFLFFPILNARGQLRTRGNVNVHFCPHILQNDRIISRRVIISPLRIRIYKRSFLLMRRFLPMNRIAPSTRMKTTYRNGSRVTRKDRRVIRYHPFIRPTFTTFMTTMSRRRLNA